MYCLTGHYRRPSQRRSSSNVRTAQSPYRCRNRITACATLSATIALPAAISGGAQSGTTRSVGDARR